MEYFNEEDYAYLKDLYINKTKHLSRWIWRNNLSDEDIDIWLSNFTGLTDSNPEHEQLNSLFLLKQYMFFSLVEVRELLLSLYRIHFYKDCIHRLRKEHATSDLDVLQELYDDELNHTRFFGIGNPSESSSLLLYFFRQVNGIPKSQFWNVQDIFMFNDNAQIIGLRKDKTVKNGTEVLHPIDNYVFIDDLTGSGTQASDFFKEDTSINIFAKIKEYNQNARIYYFTLFSTKEARQKFIDVGLGDIIIKSIFELDRTYKLYGEDSRYFPKLRNEADPKEAHIIEKKYAELICKQNFHRFNLHDIYKCGYKDSQLLLSFFYNTPDNTIPIFWSETPIWNSIFKRYDKIY